MREKKQDKREAIRLNGHIKDERTENSIKNGTKETLREERDHMKSNKKKIKKGR